MPIEIIKPDIWAQFGPLGLVCLSLFILVIWILRNHRDERREMREEANMRVKQMLDVQRETNLAIQGMTTALEKQTERGLRGEPHAA